MSFQCHNPDLNHPWVFVSIIISGGYWEVTPDVGWKDGVGPLKRRWCGPGRILFRPANWIHSVQLEPGIEPVTLILRGRKSQGWGFWCPRGFRPWREHMAATDATGSGCG